MHTSIHLLVRTQPIKLQRNTSPTLLAAVKGGPVGARGLSALFSATVQTGNFTPSLNTVNRYDPTGGTFTITAPAASDNDEFTIKNVSASVVAVLVSGGVASIEDEATFSIVPNFMHASDGGVLTYKLLSGVWYLI